MPPPPSRPRVFHQRNCAGAWLPKAVKCLPAAWDGSKVWEGFGFAEEHLALVGAAVLCQGAAALGLHSQPSTRSEQEQQLLAGGRAVPVWLCQRGCASPWPGSSLGAWLGKVGSRLSPLHQQRRVRRVSSRWLRLCSAGLTGQTRLCGCRPADRLVPGESLDPSSSLQAAQGVRWVRAWSRAVKLPTAQDAACPLRCSTARVRRCAALPIRGSQSTAGM